MKVGSSDTHRAYLMVLLCLPVRDTVLAQVGVSAFPLERAESKQRRRPHPHAMLFAEMGSMGRARRGLSWLRRELAGRWVAQDGWVRVPASEGRAFRRMLITAVDRYGTLEAKKSIQHVDLYSNSEQRAARNYRNRRPSSPLAPMSRAAADV